MVNTSKSLVFLSYGDGINVDETIFSILSALYWLKNANSVHVIVLTDTPLRFADLGVTVDALTPERLQSWLGTGTYKHRRKLEAMRYALNTYGGSVALVDSDTWFRRSPADLLERIGPGRCCMHLMESKLIDSGTPTNIELADFLRRSAFQRLDGSTFTIHPNSPMWNSGVIGLHADDAIMIDQALNYLDQLDPCAALVHTVEQFAVTQAFTPMGIQETGDVVFHYWPDRVRKPFQHRVRSIVSSTENLPLADRTAATFIQRPQASLQRRCIMAVKRAMQLLGLPVRGVRASG